ncbi:daunorubicin C-13 ketoreductase [Ilyonectria destructans]|nr:daunorubicin C-13 ketoreductase [Ilyonectria destructans]
MEQAWGVADIPDLQGKVAVVTGACSGVGLATVGQLATHGAKVYFTGRSLSKAEKARKTLLETYPEANSNNVNVLLLDLTDLKSITDAADELRTKEAKIDILINNASASTASTELVGAGWEEHITTNLIGPFLFVNRLMPLFKNATVQREADVRIVNIGSTAPTAFLPRNFVFQFDKPSGFSKPVLQYPLQWRLGVKFLFSWDLIRYSVSKAAVVLFTTELQRRLDAQGLPILTSVVHPGEVNTEGLAAVNNFFLNTMARLFFISPEQGALSPLFAATAKQVRQSPETYKAKFLLPVGKSASPHPVAEDGKQIKGLWDNTTVELNKALDSQGLPALGPW